MSNYEALHRHFSEDGIIELTGLIAFQNMSSKFNAALVVDPQEFCTIAPQLQRPTGNFQRV